MGGGARGWFILCSAAIWLPNPPQDCGSYYLSCDYGTVNPFSCGLWGEREGTWYRLREYYYDSRREGRQKTDEEYYAELETLVSGLPIHAVIVDPSAASFIACIRRHQTYRAIPAQNEVLGRASGGCRMP